MNVPLSAAKILATPLDDWKEWVVRCTSHCMD